MGSRRIGRRIGVGLKLDACVLSVDGAEAVRETRAGSWENPRELGALAAAALSSAARTACFGSWDGALNTVKTRTLEGRRVIVTRAPEQSKELLERLEELGAEAVLLPLVRFVEPENTADLDQAIRSLDTIRLADFHQRQCRNVFSRPLPRAGMLARWRRWPKQRGEEHAKDCRRRLGHRAGPQEGGLASFARAARIQRRGARRASFAAPSRRKTFCCREAIAPARSCRRSCERPEPRSPR